MSERIVIDPEVCGGRPIVDGTRMRVSDILDALAMPVTIDELLTDFTSHAGGRAGLPHLWRAGGDRW